MKIQKISIQNFRNIKSLDFDVSNATIISGENDLGKSNALNAIVWFFTDKLYTDNSGVGENDVNSIVPKNQIKGEHTSVSVEFVDGPTFTKVYKTGYDRATGKANKHTTEGSINNVACKNMNDFYVKLYEAVGYVKCFASPNEVQTYIDPLYALQKMNSKDLRTFLVSVGCTATNEELFEAGFEDLRQYEKKYLGDYVSMRLDLKKQIKAAKESVEKYEILLSQYNSVEEFDEEKLLEINRTIEEYNSTKAAIVSGGNNAAIKELEFKLKEKRIELSSARQLEINNINSKITELSSKLHLEEKRNESIRDNEIKEIEGHIRVLEAGIGMSNASQHAYEGMVETSRKNLESTQKAASQAVSRKKTLQAELILVKQREFDNFVYCPNCGYEFTTDPEAVAKFEENKAKEIERITQEIYKLNEDIANYKNTCDDIVAKAEKAKEERESVKKDMEEVQKAIDERKKYLTELRNTQVNDSKLISDLKAEINELRLELDSIDTTSENEEIIKIKADIDALKNSDNSVMLEQLNEINKLILDAEETREELYIERSNWKTKVAHSESLKNAYEALNDIDYLLGRVEGFIHAMIKLINDKAKAKTGIDFVMLEENLGNDGIKEVCYATVDGIPFANINTAKKYEYGIKFIEKVKDIAENDFHLFRNDFPILADKFEGIDHIEKIKSLTREQLVCTRVGLEKNITIL